MATNGLTSGMRLVPLHNEDIEDIRHITNNDLETKEAFAIERILDAYDNLGDDAYTLEQVTVATGFLVAEFMARGLPQTPEDGACMTEVALAATGVLLAEAKVVSYGGSE